MNTSGPNRSPETHAGRSSYGPPTIVLFALALAVLVVGQCWAESTPNVNHDSPVEYVANHGPVRVTTRVDRSSARIADKITLTLSVVTPTGVHVSLPAKTARLGDFEVVGTRDMLDIPVDDGRLSTRTYELESLAAGEHTIPAITLPYFDKTAANVTQGAAESQPVQVSISSLLEGQVDPTKFRDIKGLVVIERPESSGALLFATGIGVLLLSGAVLAFAIRNRRNRELSPEEWALVEIGRLKLASESGELNAETFYTGVTDIVRIYVERQFQIAAPRLTTTEFFDCVQSSNELTQQHTALLRSFLSIADMVKFAGLELNAAEAANVTEKARQLIREMAANASIVRSLQEAE